MTVRRVLAAVATALVLTGCGQQYEESRAVVQGVLQGLVPGRAEAGAPPRPQFSRAALEEAGVDFVLASVPQRGVAALLQKAGSNGPEETWIAEDGVSVTYERGFVVATRGLGPDLMAANVTAVRAAVRQGGGTAVRVHEYLDGNDQIVRHDYTCRITRLGAEAVEIYERRYATTRYQETCERGGQTFENTYWIDQAGVVWKSRQLISPPVGYLDSEKL